MTGPPYLGGKSSPARSGNPVADTTSTTVYQLSLAAVLPWLEAGGDRTFKHPSTVSSNNSSSKKDSGIGVKSQRISAALSPYDVSSTHTTKRYSLEAHSSSPNPNGIISNSCSSTVSSTGARSKVYNIQLPVLNPNRSVRQFGSFGSWGAGGGSLGGGLTIASPGSEYASSMPVPLPPQSSLHLSSLGSQTSGQESNGLRLVIRGRGLSRTPVEDTQPIDSIKDIDILTKPYGHNLQTALDSQLDTPCSSGRSSPTITVTQSPLPMSRGGWTTGNTTESSLDSSYSMDDFDKLATNTVSQHFEEINSVLFEGLKETLTPQADVARECHEWSSQFPHLRVLGKQVCPAKDMGYYHLPSPHGSRPTSSLASLDATDSGSTCSDSQGLSLTGRSVSAMHAPIVSLSGNGSDSSAYSSFVEEVIEEDGVYEDVIAVDYKNIYEDNMENKKQITPQRRRIGYPPITPNACVKDSVMSGVFDHVWQEIMSWMRELLKKYTSEISDSRNEIVSYLPTNNIPSTLMSREVSFIMQNSRQFSFQRSNTHMGSSTEKSINELLHITSMPLKNRPHGHQLMDLSESHVLGSSTQSGSSFQSQSRPTSHLRPSQRGTRLSRLAPIAKTSSFDEERASHPTTEALRVKGRNPMTNDPMPSPTSTFHRNGSLPPLELERTQYRKLHQGYRAASAIDNKDMRLLSIRDRTHFSTDQTRPNTTNAMRSDAPFFASNNQSRRSSTALGNSYSFPTRNSLLLNRSLDIRGNSLQPGNDTIHIHPDIQEDLQECTGEDIYNSHWNAPQPSHSMYRRSRVTLR